MDLKLGDFGLAAWLLENNEWRYTVCGTPNYIAPEILGKKGHGYKVDIWCVGIIIYTLLLGKHPFESSDLVKTYKNIKDLNYQFPDDH